MGGINAPPQGFGGGGGGAGYSTKAEVSGQSGEYVFDQTPSNGGKIEATVAPSGGFVEQRSNSFAADGVPNIDARGTDFEDVLGPGERQRVYMWERDVSSPSTGTESPGAGPYGITWDGSNFYHTDDSADRIYELDSDLSETGNSFATPTNSPRGIAWDGNEFLHAVPAAVGGVDPYLYFLDTSFSVVGGSSPPTAARPSGVTYDGTNYFVTVAGTGNTPYIYELDSDLNLVGGSSPPGSNPTGIQWEGENFIHTDRSANYYYILDSNLSVIGGSAAQGGNRNTRDPGWDGGEIQIPHDQGEEIGYIYQFGGSFDFMAGLQTG